MTYRNKVRELRLRSLMATQTELARLTGIHQTTLSRIESQQFFLSSRQALAIRDALGCSLDDLFERIPEEES